MKAWWKRRQAWNSRQEKDHALFMGKEWRSCMRQRKAQIDALVKKVCIAAGLCLALTACDYQKAPEQDRKTVSDQGKKKPDKVSSVNADQKEKPEVSKGSAKRADVWKGYAQEHTDLIGKYPEWFDEAGKFVYPFHQGSKGWAKSDIATREKKCCIPEEIVDSLDTPQLLEAVAAYPLIEYIRLADGRKVGGKRSRYQDLKAGIEKVSGVLPAMGELMKRGNLIPAAYSYYRGAAFTKRYDGREGKFSAGNVASRQERYQILLVEYILCTKKAYDMMGREERETVARKAARIERDRKEERERDEKLRREYPGKVFCALPDSEEDTFAVLAYSKSEKPGPWKRILENHGVFEINEMMSQQD